RRDAAPRAGRADRRLGAAGATGRVLEDAAALADRRRDLAVAGRAGGAHDGARHRAPARGAGRAVAHEGLGHAEVPASGHAGAGATGGGHVMPRRGLVAAILAFAGLVGLVPTGSASRARESPAVPSVPPGWCAANR